MEKILADMPMANSKTLNTLRALEYIRTFENVTTAQLSENMSIPIATAYRTVQSLIDSGLITQSDKQGSFAGRKAVVYSVDSSYKYMLGIYMEKNYLNIFIVDMIGNIPDHWREYYAKDVSLEHILQMIDRGIEHISTSFFGNAEGFKKIDIIGFAAEAAIDSATGTIIAFANLECMNGFNIKEYLQKTYNVTVHAIKSMHLRTCIYLNDLKKQDLNNYIYFGIGAGIGAGIVFNGELYEGANGNAGELESRELEDDENDLLPYIAYSTQGIYKHMRQYLNNEGCDKNLINFIEQKSSNYSLQSELRDMKQLDAAVEYGDPYLTKIVDQAVTGWAHLGANLLLFYDPQIMLIGGEITRDTPHIFRMLSAEIKANIQIQCPIVPAGLKNTKIESLAMRVLDYAYDDIYQELGEIK